MCLLFLFLSLSGGVHAHGFIHVSFVSFNFWQKQTLYFFPDVAATINLSFLSRTAPATILLFLMFCYALFGFANLSLLSPVCHLTFFTFRAESFFFVLFVFVILDCTSAWELLISCASLYVWTISQIVSFLSTFFHFNYFSFVAVSCAMTLNWKKKRTNKSCLINLFFNIF